MATITYEAATRFYPGSERPAVDGLEISIEDGEFLVLVGPSGCGKSTSLRMLAGLEDVDEGAIRIGDRDVTTLAPGRRDVAMVFQSYALYPHMNVAENMAFALEMAKMPKQERRRRVREAARILDLEPFLDRKPKSLSGGQRQRVAMGRAIVREPQAFLMDEPLSNLDAKLRVSTRSQIAALQKRLGVTTVYVTHDQVEAMTMGDRVAVLNEGVLQQCDSPRALYQRPANAFVAGFIGSPAMNIREFAVHDGHARIGDRDVEVSDELRAALADEGLDRVLLGFRPESVDLVGPSEGFTASVQLVEELGADAYLYCSIAGTDHAGDPDIVTRIDPARPPRVGETVHLRVRAGHEHAFSPVTGERLSS
ncbi:carbohydrate ABC transporter ATP-binding protein, CUT1 family [Haloechinothrix alba]|uniref:Carbohydrate ABC transporter ATP-binding protein, CUT1 family n=1 Tax=Haloechinothrix alba TaxID=664784 RepID=A0A238VQ55_9PSEU|nr:sn-glycerol-3-phosphate ABC transporter ATP-binding protein UgpC [Haloechinothrix alba]SNR36274.1 carbohydrate ABC transporter ATP-binding protein, CUT1 family [Haloechinothrix alba]